jgi:hypothetical protein
MDGKDRFNEFNNTSDEFNEPAASESRGDEPAPPVSPPRVPEPVISEPVSANQPEPPSTISKAASSVSNTISNASEGLTNFFGSVSASSVFVGAVIAAIVALVVAYILYRIITGTVSNRKGATIPETKVPIMATTYMQGNGSVIPAAGNGKRMSINFWIYIHDIDKYKGLYRHVFHRGDKKIDGASPTVFLDKDLNKLYVRFESTLANTNNKPISSMSKPYSTDATGAAQTAFNTSKTDYFKSSSATDADKIKADLLTRGIAIDYIPLQRWVFVSVVVNEEVQKGTISAYIDGELVKTVTSDQYVQLSGNKSVAGATATPVTNEKFFNNFQNLMLDKGGDVWVGGNEIDATIGPGFAGLVSSISFFNYDMNAKDIYDVYVKGPIDNILAKMGLPAYGVRSPVYRIG